MRNLNRVLILAFFVSLNAGFVFAETVILKSGEKVEGKIIEKNDTFIKVDFFGVPLTHYLADIESIDGQPVTYARTIDPQGNPQEKQVIPGKQESLKPYTVNEALDSAIAYVKNGDHSKAQSVYCDALNLDPSIHLSMFLWAAGQDKAGKQIDALHGYVMVFGESPFYYLKMLYERWVVYRQKGLLGQTISELDDKIKNEPSNAGAYSGRGFLYILEGDLAKAMEYFNKAVSLDPNCAEAYANRGIIYAIQGHRTDLAYADYHKAFALDPRCVDAYNLGVMLLVEKKDLEGAHDLAKKAIAKYPNNEFINLLAGILAQTMSHDNVRLPSDEALVYYTKVLSINPDNMIAYFMRATEYTRRESPDLAINDYSKAIPLFPDDYWPYMFRSQLYELVGQNDKSLIDLDKAKELMGAKPADEAGQTGLSAGQ